MSRTLPCNPLAPASVLFLILLLAGCQVVIPPVPIPATTSNVSTPAATAEPKVEAMAPLPLAQARPPAHLAIPDLNLEAPVTPMGWDVAEVGGKRTTEWVVPAKAIGWQVNSAGAGGAGRVVLAGHQMAEAALLAPLAQGAVVPGQEIRLTDDEGVVFVYRVTEVSEPIPLVGATAEEEALANSYVAPSAQPLLTLVTGWPDFTTTHRVFAVAELVGLQK